MRRLEASVTLVGLSLPEPPFLKKQWNTLPYHVAYFTSSPSLCLVHTSFLSAPRSWAMTVAARLWLSTVTCCCGWQSNKWFTQKSEGNLQEREVKIIPDPPLWGDSSTTSDSPLQSLVAESCGRWYGQVYVGNSFLAVEEKQSGCLVSPWLMNTCLLKQIRTKHTSQTSYFPVGHQKWVTWIEHVCLYRIWGVR
jgi:hypothetical protein